MTTRAEDLTFGEERITWRAVTDGTLTTVELLDEDDEVLGEGESRRRKGDRRNVDLGIALALARAFEDASARYYEAATKLGWGEIRLEFTKEEADQLRSALTYLIATATEVPPA